MNKIKRISTKVIKGSNQLAPGVIKLINSIYCEQNEYSNGFDMKEPGTVMICYLTNEKGLFLGGMILDQIRNTANNNGLSICTTLGVAKDYRGQGLSRRLLDAAEIASNDIGKPFCGAYVDGGREIELWKYYGFKVQGNVGFGVTMTKRKVTEMMGLA